VTVRKRPPSRLGIDPLATASIFAGLAGGLSLAEPYFGALTFALAALATVVWWVRWPRGRRPSGAPTARLVAWTPPLAWAGAWGSWALGAPVLHGYRSAALGAAVVVAWAISRSEAASKGWDA
jgi:hypothetical protein